MEIPDNLVISNTFNVSGIYEYFLTTSDNSRSSSFEEGVPDVPQYVVQEPIKSNMSVIAQYPTKPICEAQ